MNDEQLKAIRIRAIIMPDLAAWSNDSRNTHYLSVSGGKTFAVCNQDNADPDERETRADQFQALAHAPADIRALLAAYDAQAAKLAARDERIAVLEGALRGLIENAPLTAHDNPNACLYCGQQVYKWQQEYNPLRIECVDRPHAPDCAWQQAQRLIGDDQR